jgi:hypothetical protein
MSITQQRTAWQGLSRVLTSARTDLDLIEYFDNFAFGEVCVGAPAECGLRWLTHENVGWNTSSSASRNGVPQTDG